MEYRKNNKLISPNVVMIQRDGEYVQRIDSSGSDCHYLHRGEKEIGSLSLCGDTNLAGIITTMDGDVYELSHVNQEHPIAKRMMKTWSNDSKNSGDRRAKMIQIKRAAFPEEFEMAEPIDFFARENQFYDDDINGNKLKRSKGSKRIIETAVFVDEKAYKNFNPYFKRSKTDFRDFIISYINGVQSIYHHSSLKDFTFDISIVRLEIYSSQPRKLNDYGGERTKLLKSFCKYQSELNKASNEEIGHWDVGLYVSGLDFYADSRGKPSYVTMGLAAVDAICSSTYNCVIAELGVTNSKGKPYPSAGFTSVYVMAHELGHNLGLHHDGKAGDNSCNKNGYLMSPSRGTKGETQWSSCSISKLTSKDYPCLENDLPGSPSDPLSNRLPGETWDMDRQCQLFLMDTEARAQHTDSTYSDVCYALKCRTSKRLGWYRAGPALDGTFCGDGKWCKEGKCVKNEGASQIKPSKWSDWNEGSCKTECLSDSKGFRTKSRYCMDDGGSAGSIHGCKGKSESYEFCDDSDMCSERVNPGTYASKKCKEFMVYVPDLKPVGAQAIHNKRNPSQSCSIYCLKEGKKKRWYTPQLDLNDIRDIDAFFPDGTYCHKDDDGTKYYCQRHACIPEGARFGKSNKLDLNLNQNAGAPKDKEVIPQELQKFFYLDKNLKPISTSISTKGIDLDNDYEFEDNDDDFIVSEIP